MDGVSSVGLKASEASIHYKNEAELLRKAEDVDKVYVEKVLPEKMKYNLENIRKFGLRRDIQIMIMTLLAVCGKTY